MNKTSFIVVDLETTGLQAALDSIIEIAAVKIVNGEVVGEWDTLINPGVFVPHESTQINGITSDMLLDSPKFEEVAQEFLDFMGNDSVFVAHNVDFDFSFMNNNLKKYNFPALNLPCLCTFKLAKKVHPNLPKYGLGSLSEHFGIDLPQAHRALHDARATATLLSKFLRTLRDGGVKHPKDIPVIQNIPLSWKEPALEGQVSLF